MSFWRRSSARIESTPVAAGVCATLVTTSQAIREEKNAAAIFSADGTLVVLREDVGRHNAVDKVLGYGLREGLIPFESHVLMVSGRTSFEIMQKALAGRIPVVCSVSAPSSLAVDFARASGQTLVGFLRERRMNVYAGVSRIKF